VLYEQGPLQRALEGFMESVLSILEDAVVALTKVAAFACVQHACFVPLVDPSLFVICYPGCFAES
jgi:hypothetical protein